MILCRPLVVMVANYFGKVGELGPIPTLGFIIPESPNGMAARSERVQVLVRLQSLELKFCLPKVHSYDSIHSSPGYGHKRNRGREVHI